MGTQKGETNVRVPEEPNVLLTCEGLRRCWRAIIKKITSQKYRKNPSPRLLTIQLPEITRVKIIGAEHYAKKCLQTNSEKKKSYNGKLDTLLR